MDDLLKNPWTLFFPFTSSLIPFNFNDVAAFANLSFLVDDFLSWTSGNGGGFLRNFAILFLNELFNKKTVFVFTPQLRFQTVQSVVSQQPIT